MGKDEIIKAIGSEIDYCETTMLGVNPTFARSQLQILDLVGRYMLSKYKDGDSDSLGFKKVFYNIVNFPVDIASKMVDLDVKDIVIMAEEDNYWTSYIMQKELYHWMKENYFGTLLNQLAYNLPRDGHLIVKKVKDKVEIVPIKNLRFRPNAVDIKNIPIIERHQYLPDEFLVTAKSHGWEDYNLVSLKPSEVVTGYLSSNYYTDPGKIDIYEAWFPKGFLEGVEDNYFIVSFDGVILASSKMEKSPYKDLAWEKIEGRTLGRGQVEKLFEEQIYLNRMANHKAEGLYWTSKHIYQTKDNSVAKNLLASIDNGDVMIVNSEITPIVNEERNLSFYNYDEARWEKNALRKSFTQESITGERAPSGTPLGSSILNAQQQAGYYRPKKQNFANFIKEILWDWVLSEFTKEKRPEHAIMMENLMASDGQSDKFFNLLVDEELKNKKRKALFNGKPLIGKAEELMKSVVAEGLKNKKIKIPRGLYDNLNYKIDIVITGEEIDVASKLTTLQTLLQILGSNPTIWQDPNTRKIISKMMNIAGFNPKELVGDEIPSIADVAGQARAQVGGSIAKPLPTKSPSMVGTETAV